MSQKHIDESMVLPGIADAIYRRFFKAAILTMFTFGCVLQAVHITPQTP